MAGAHARAAGTLREGRPRSAQGGSKSAWCPSRAGEAPGSAGSAWEATAVTSLKSVTIYLTIPTASDLHRFTTSKRREAARNGAKRRETAANRREFLAKSAKCEFCEIYAKFAKFKRILRKNAKRVQKSVWFETGANRFVDLRFGRNARETPRNSGESYETAENILRNCVSHWLAVGISPPRATDQRCNSEKHPVWANFSPLGAMIHHPALQGLSRQTGHGFAPIRPASRPRPPKTRSMAGTKA